MGSEMCIRDRVYRVTFGEEVLNRTTLDNGPERKLYYTPPHTNGSDDDDNTIYQVSVVYMRAGHDPGEYNELGHYARLRLERSHAIKCPPISAQLAGLKVIQQALTNPGAVERFLPAEEAARVRATFMPIYPLDETPQGLIGREIALDASKAINYVLKPSLEGGSHNVYRGDIPAYLAKVPKTEWHKYILMEMIQSPQVSNVLLSSAGMHKGPVISELGVFGFCMWDSRQYQPDPAARDDGDVAPSPPVMLHNHGTDCWSFKTKNRAVDEMSVVKGYGCFDSPMLYDQP